MVLILLKWIQVTSVDCLYSKQALVVLTGSQINDEAERRGLICEKIVRHAQVTVPMREYLDEYLLGVSMGLITLGTCILYNTTLD